MTRDGSGWKHRLARLNMAPPTHVVGGAVNDPLANGRGSLDASGLRTLQYLQVSVIGDTSSLTAGTPRNMMQALGDHERFLRASSA